MSGLIRICHYLASIAKIKTVTKYKYNNLLSTAHSNVLMIKTLNRYKFIGKAIKVCVTLSIMISLINHVSAQSSTTINLQSYDEKFIHYGFLIGGHVSRYRIKHNEAFTTPALDSIHSIDPGNLGGFKLGFVVNFHLFQYLDFRILPTVGFYQNNLLYRFTDGTSLEELRDPTWVELPLMFKYKSVRRGNTRMYITGGVNPQIKASGKSSDEDATERLLIKGTNLSLEIGVGFDMYQPLFKFSPEIRYSYGITNVLDDEENIFSAGLQSITTHNITFFITFEGGPG